MLTKVQCPKVPKSERNLSLTWHQMVFLNWSHAMINSAVAFRARIYKDVSILVILEARQGCWHFGKTI